MKQVDRYPSYDFSTYSSILPNTSSQNTLLLEPSIEEGEKVSYTRADHQIVGHITSINNKQQTTYELLTKEGTTLTTTKEFIFPIDEEDLITLPTNTKEFEIKSKDLTKEEWTNIIAPPGPKVLRTELMMWHCRLNHLPFINMFKLSEQGYLPKRFLLFNNNQYKLYCPSCIFAKMKRRPWRNKGHYRPIRRENENAPGIRVSVDQILSQQPGFIGIIEGIHIKNDFTVFKDHFTNLSYSILNTPLNTE